MKTYKLIIVVTFLLLSSIVGAAQGQNTNDDFCKIEIVDDADGLKLGKIDEPAINIADSIGSKTPYIVVGDKHLTISRTKGISHASAQIFIKSLEDIISDTQKFDNRKHESQFDNKEYIDSIFTDPQEITLSVKNNGKERSLSFFIAHEYPKFEGIATIELKAYREGKDHQKDTIKFEPFAPEKDINLKVNDSIAQIIVCGGKNAKFDSLTFNGVPYKAKEDKAFLDAGNTVFEIGKTIKDTAAIECVLKCVVFDKQEQKLIPQDVTLFTSRPMQADGGNPFSPTVVIIIAAVILLLVLLASLCLWLLHRQNVKKTKEIEQQLEPIRNNLTSYGTDQQSEIDKILNQIDSIKLPQGLKAYLPGFDLKKKNSLLDELTRLLREYDREIFSNRLNAFRINIENSPCSQVIKNYVNSLTDKVAEKIGQGDNAEIEAAFTDLEGAIALLKEQPVIISKTHEDILDFLNKLITEGIDYNEPNGDVRLKTKVLKKLWEQEGKDAGKSELIGGFKQTEIYKKYIVTASLHDQDFNTYLSNLVETVRSEAIPAGNNNETDKPELQRLEGKINDLTKKLSDQEKDLTEAKEAKKKAENLKKDAEESRNKFYFEKGQAEEKLKETNEELTTALQQIKNLENQHPTFESLSEEEQKQIKDQAAEAVKNDHDRQIADLKKANEEAINEAVKKAEEEARNAADAEKEKAVAEVQNRLDQANRAAEDAQIGYDREKQAWNEEKSRLNSELLNERNGRADDLKKAELEKTQAVEKAITDTRTEQENQREQAVNALRTELTNQINSVKDLLKKEEEGHLATQLKAEKDLKDAQQHELKALNEAEVKFAEKYDKIIRDKDETIQSETLKVKKLKNNIRDERESLAVNMQTYIKRMHQASKKAFENARGNYKQEGDRIMSGIGDLFKWFVNNIVTRFQSSEDFTQDQIMKMMQQELIDQCENKYSFVVELMRMKAYRSISKEWNTWFIMQGVEIDDMQKAYDELIGLLGLCNITATVPALFIDAYSDEKFENNIVDTYIENFVPDGFDHRQKTNAVRDLVLPGLYVDGKRHSKPVVWA